MKGKDFLTFSELTPAELKTILDLSSKLKRGRRSGFGSKTLAGKSVALVFEKPSTRTRVSFQVAANELGASAVALNAAEMQLGRGETIEDTGRVLSRYVHLVAARVNEHSSVERLARSSTIPVVNALSDIYHPVQVLADLLTLRERKGKLKGLKVAWVGDGDNVCNSWAIAAALAGVDFVAATPEGFEPSGAAVSAARRLASKGGGSVTVVRDPAQAAKGADCLMTDTFVSMGFEAEKERRIRALLPKYRVDSRLMSLAKKDAIFEHCLPAHRGEEVSEEVIDGPQSVVFDEAENKLHTSKALFCLLLRPREGRGAIRL